jgi:Tol biopolymer transport system component
MRKGLTVLLAAAVMAFLAAAPAADAAFPGSNGLIAFVKGQNIWVMNQTGGNQHRLAVNGFEPAWNPAGTRIAFEWAGDIYTINANGGGRTQVTTAASSEDAPAWSADGRWIYFTSDRADPGQGDRGIYRLRSTRPFGAVQTVVPEVDFQDVLAPAVAANGRFAYLFNSDSTVFGGCCEVTVRTGSTDNGISFANGYGNLAWGPGSNILAYGDFIPDPSDPESDIGSHIHTIKPNGTGFRTLNRPGGTTNFYDSDPAFSPNGAWIAFDETFGGGGTQRGIWKMKVDGSGRVRLSATGMDPDWQPVP